MSGGWLIALGGVFALILLLVILVIAYYSPMVMRA